MSAADYGEYDERPRRDVLEYLEIPLRYPHRAWIPFVVVLAVAIVLGLIMPRKYRSATLILVESKNVPEYYVMPVSAEGMAQRLSTIRQLVMSRTRLEQVIQKFDPYPEMQGWPTQAVVETMRKSIEIRVQGADSFVIEYVNRDPQKAMAITNQLAAQFMQDAADLRETMTKKAFDFIQTSLGEARRNLEAREEALREHKRKYQGALPEQLDANLRVLQQLQAEQQTLGETLRTLEDRRAVLERSLLEGRRLAGNGGGPAELLRMRATYNTLLGRYTEDHPDMRALRARIEKLEKQLGAGQQEGDEAEKEQAMTDPEAAALGRSLRRVEADLDTLKARREGLDDKIAVYQSRVEQTPKAEQELAALTRDYQQLRDAFNLASKKEMDAEMGQKLEEYWRGGYFRVLDPAHLPRTPIRPYMTMFLLGGLVVATVVGLASAFLADLTDRSVKSERELEDLLHCPVLISLPRTAAQGGATA